MASPVYTIFEIFDNLKLETKRQVVADLQKKLDAAEVIASVSPRMTYLQELWEDIEQNLFELSMEPYIDDQFEIEEIWNIVEGFIKSGKYKNESWEVREHILHSIVDNDFYDYYGVYDPMKDLSDVLCFNNNEKRELADYMWKSSKYMRKHAADIYREIGGNDRYYRYLEENLSHETEPYIELVKHYAEIDEKKALEIAECCRTKCTKNLEEIYIYMFQCALNHGDDEEIQRLIRSAKRRRGVNTDVIQEAVGIGFEKKKVEAKTAKR